MRKVASLLVIMTTMMMMMMMTTTMRNLNKVSRGFPLSGPFLPFAAHNLGKHFSLFIL